MSNDDSMETLNSLRVSAFEEDEVQVRDIDTDTDADADADTDTDADTDDENDGEPVTLGFLEKPINGWSLLRQFFPSKTGGVPAWLDPTNLPSGKSCVCGICGEPLQFLLQAYAPISVKDSAFHRTLFVFMCPSRNCLLRDQREQCKWGQEEVSRSVKVFSCQLPRANPFYSNEAPKNDGTDKPLGNGAALCNWCGTWKGNEICSSCRRANYCSKEHQAMHWRSGHEVDCLQMTTSSESSQSNPSNGITTSTENKRVASKTQWPEYEIIDEDEPKFDTEVPENVPKNLVEETVESSLVDKDKMRLASVQAIIAKAPEQVLRYCRSARAKPLWFEPEGRLDKADIPNCSYCGGPRIFELQIMPQMHYFFGVKDDKDGDCLDWATIVVYTCEASCDANVGYKEEFAWVQLFPKLYL